MEWTMENARSWHWVPCKKTEIDSFQGNPIEGVHIHVSGCKGCIEDCVWSWRTEKGLKDRIKTSEVLNDKSE